MKTKISRSFLMLLPFLLGIYGMSCIDAGVDPAQFNIDLSILGTSCTEAWLRAHLDTAPGKIEVRVTDGRRFQVDLVSTDSILRIDGLSPGTSYSFVARRLIDGHSGGGSAEVLVSTLDTTSHNYTWETTLLGDGSGSILRDVTIINDTLAYAVGAIYRNDSTGNIDTTPYNLARWNGTRWDLLRIPFYSICGQSHTTPYPTGAITNFGVNDVWIAMSGDQIVRFNGSTQNQIMCLPVSFTIYKLWGEGSNSVYAVGDEGNIFHYDGSTWKQIESGVTYPVYDIWGSRNPFVGTLEILALASDNFAGSGKKILSIRNDNATAIPDSGLSWSLSSVWFESSTKYFICGGGIFEGFHVLDMFRWTQIPYVTIYYTDAIRGTGLNDIITIGAFGACSHYNGLTWQSYPEVMINGLYLGLSMKGNLIMTVGVTASNKAIALIGRRG